MVDAVKKYAGVDFDAIPDTEAAKKLADEKGIHYEARHTKGDILNLFFEEFVEVAENAANLEHTLHSAYNKPL
mgnify:CR=1 FL=1